MIVRYVSPGGRLTAEPELVSFWAPADGVVTPIEGENYQDVPTTRHQQLLRDRAQPADRTGAVGGLVAGSRTVTGERPRDAPAFTTGVREGVGDPAAGRSGAA